MPKVLYSYEEHRKTNRLWAADALEDLIVVAQEMVKDLRVGADPEADRDAYLRSNDTSYARVYWFRRQLGYIVSSLGYGAPPTWVKKLVEKKYSTMLTEIYGKRVKEQEKHDA